MIVNAGSTNVTVPFYFVDDAGGTTPGEPTITMLFSDIETGGSASYQRQGAARVDFALVTQTAAGAHTDGGFVLVDDTNMPGVCRCDIPDAAVAPGVDFVIIYLLAVGTRNTIASPLMITLTPAAVGYCVADTGGTTSSVVSSSCDPAGSVADQFKGRIIIFDKNTTTAALRGQATDITASSASATPTFTVTLLTTAPVSGDTFTIN